MMLRWVIGIAVALILACSAPSHAETVSPPPVGTVIDRNNAYLYSDFMPKALRFAILHGLKAEVVPTSHIDWPAGFQQATEKYSGQVTLTAIPKAKFPGGGTSMTIQNYIAGLPFPIIDQKDPEAARKIAYNWRWGPFVPDDVTLFGHRTSQAWTVDARTSTLAPDDNDIDYRNEEPCTQLMFLRYSHRTKVDPRPTLASDPKADWKMREDYCGGTNSWVVWKEATDFWLHPDPEKGPLLASFVTEDLRSVSWTLKQGKKAYPTAPAAKCTYSCVQFWWEFVAPQTEFFRWRLAGVRPIVACLSACGLPAAMAHEGNRQRLGQEKFEVRTAYVIEMSPYIEHFHWLFGIIDFSLLHATIYIDTETYLFLGAELEGHGISDSIVPLWQRRRLSGGGEEMLLANDFYVPGDKPDFFLSLNVAPGVESINTGRVSEKLFDAAFPVTR